MVSMVSILLIARHFEKRFAIERYPTAEIILDWKLGTTEIVLNKMLIAPITAISGAMTIKALGGGWIHLRSDGGWFLISVIVVILTLDFLSYWMKRAQHKFPVLWAMHSFHHSAEAITAVTGGRHFLFEAITTRCCPGGGNRLCHSTRSNGPGYAAISVSRWPRLHECPRAAGSVRLLAQQSAISPHPSFDRATASEQKLLQSVTVVRCHIRDGVQAGKR